MNLPISAWQNFYVIVGSSAGALIGIQFVVIALVADIRKRTTADSISAFATPTVMHLGGALIVSAIMSAPWPSLFPVSIALAACGIGGIAYSLIVVFRARRQTDYAAGLNDWVWYAILPSIIYAGLAFAAAGLRTNSRAAEFAIGAAALGLLLIGIHNAWDTVTYMVVSGRHEN